MAAADAPAAVPTIIRYLSPEIKNEKDGLEVRIGSGDSRRDVTVSHKVLVHDARRIGPTLDANGVTLVPFTSAVKDYYDDAEMRAVYYQEVARMMKQHTGAQYAVVFRHATRSEDPVAEGKRSGMGTFTHAYARFAHLDSGPNSAKFAQGVLRRGGMTPRGGGGDLDAGLTEADVAPERMDVMLCNVWKARDYTIQQNPLAVLDASTLDYAQEAVPTIFATEGGSVSGRNVAYDFKITQLRESPKHRWLYYPRQTIDEALIFKQFDSREGRGAEFHARHGFHTSFDDPTAPADAPGRRSVECGVALGFLKPVAAKL